MTSEAREWIIDKIDNSEMDYDQMKAEFMSKFVSARDTSSRRIAAERYFDKVVSELVD